MKKSNYKTPMFDLEVHDMLGENDPFDMPTGAIRIAIFFNTLRKAVLKDKYDPNSYQETEMVAKIADADLIHGVPNPFDEITYLNWMK